MVNFLILLEIIGIIMIFVALRLLLYGEGAREQKLMCYFLCGSLVQNIGYLMELMAVNMDVAVAAAKIQNIGSAFIPLCYCWFIYGYCYEKPPRKILKVLELINFIMLPIVFFNPSGLFYKETRWLMTGYGHGYLHIEYGLFYIPFLLSRIIVPYLFSLYALCRAVKRFSDQESDRQYKAILGISFLPVLALLAYVGKWASVFDFTPMVLGISLATVVILVWSRRNYDFRHLAAEVVLNNMGDGVIALDGEKRLVSYNHAAADIFTKLGTYKIGRHIRGLPGFGEEMLDEDTPRKFDINGRHYESHAKQIVDESGRSQGYVILVLDMTDTNNYIEEIKRIRRQAEQANIAKSEFLANMSHEIRTPMNAIIGLSDIIVEESQGLSVCSHAKDVQAAGKNLLAIINDILDLSKVESGRIELVESEYYIKGLVGEIVTMMDMAASQHGLVMKYEYDDTIPCQYRGDEGRIKQILINLLNNAVKFTEEGYVKITIGGRPGDNEGEELLVFQVIDTGCGIREEDQDKIFEDFKQVDSKRNRSVEGTGLGLAITKQLVQLMKGEITLTSVYGEGSTFTVVLPQKIADARTLAQVPEVPKNHMERVEVFSTEGIKALIVDDNTVNRKVARGFLKPYHFELIEAESGPESIELVKKIKFDIIFMDHMMPVMDGIEAVQIIRGECGENGTSPVIIALTANAMEGVREKFLNNGFQDFLPKPLSRKQLNDILLKWIPEKKRTIYQEENEPPLEEETKKLEGILIPGIDLEAASKNSGGSLEDYQELLRLFCMDGARKTVLLKELFQANDFENYGIEVHGLKSASANIGALELSAFAREQEDASGREDLEYLQQSFGDFFGSYEKLLSDIGMFLGEQPNDPVNVEEFPEIEQEILIEEAKKALEELENFHSLECSERVESLLCHKMDEGAREQLQEIQRQLDLFEDDAAEELLRQLLEWFHKEG